VVAPLCTSGSAHNGAQRHPTAHNEAQPRATKPNGAQRHPAAHNEAQQCTTAPKGTQLDSTQRRPMAHNDAQRTPTQWRTTTHNGPKCNGAQRCPTVPNATANHIFLYVVVACHAVLWQCDHGKSHICMQEKEYLKLYSGQNEVLS